LSPIIQSELFEVRGDLNLKLSTGLFHTFDKVRLVPMVEAFKLTKLCRLTNGRGITERSRVVTKRAIGSDRYVHRLPLCHRLAIDIVGQILLVKMLFQIGAPKCL
jgi:hypothetical protein